MVQVDPQELEQLRRINRAARAFVNAIPGNQRFRQGQRSFDELVNALFDMKGDSATKEWRCFFCDEVMHSPIDARNHFGSTENAQAVCRIKTPGEFALLTALRDAEDVLARYRAEDSGVLRAMHAMIADHQTSLRREEDRGYARGIQDLQGELKDARQCVGMLVHAAGGQVTINPSHMDSFNPSATIESMVDPETNQRIIKLTPVE